MKKRLNESMEIHDELNPKLWQDSESLRPEVKEALLKIKEVFIENTELPINIIATHLVGSNVSYNYTPYSDLDLHFVVNFDSIPAPKELVQAYYNGERSAFNKAHDISIHGVNVEVYVEDVNAGTMSNGIYHLETDTWIKRPNKITGIQVYDTTELVDDWKYRINVALNSSDLDSVQKCIDALYLMRKNSIASEGEYGMGNQVFKDIRNLGLLDNLKKVRDKLISQRLTLESFTENYYLGDMFRMNLD